MLWSCSGLQYSTLIKETIPLELGLLFSIFLSQFMLLGAMLACSCFLINNLTTSSTICSVTTHEFSDAKLVSGFSTEGSVESTMRKSDHVKLGQMLLTLNKYKVKLRVIIGSIESYMVSTQSHVSLWFGYFDFSAWQSQECQIRNTLWTQPWVNMIFHIWQSVTDSLKL